MNNVEQRLKELNSILIFVRNRMRTTKEIEKLPPELASLPIFGDKVKTGDISSAVNSYIDILSSQVEDLYFILLVSRFENIAFQEMGKTTYTFKEKIKEVVEPYPFYFSKEDFIVNHKTAGRGLGVIKDLLENKISVKLYQDLSSVIEYRDYLSHGRRWLEPTKVDFKDASSILNEVLKAIKSEA